MKRWFAIGMMFALFVALGISITAIPVPSQFELDGNAVVDGGAGGDDWANTVPPPPSPGSEAFASTFVPDGSGNATIFTGGGSKDINDVSQWAWKDQLGGLPDKDNITNAYAAAYTNAEGKLVIYFGLDRYANDGDAQVGFWFFKNQVQAINGKFVGPDGVTPATHSVGDVLILGHLLNGGAVISLEAFRWNGSGLTVIDTVTNAKCGENSDPRVCLISNTSPTTAPWAYTPKQGTSGTFPTFSFIEGGVETELLGGDAAGCFSSFLAETRSSQSPTATLKDFALGQFNTCDVNIVKECPTVTYDQATNLLTYTSLITVTNNGFGTVFDVTVNDTPTAPAAPATFTLASLATGASHTFTHTFTYTPSLSSPNPPNNTATVTAATAPGGQQIIDGGSAVAVCPQVQFDSALTITKSCSSSIEVLNDKLVVAVNVAGEVCNVPPLGGPFAESINNVVVSDTPAFADGNISLGTLTPGQCQPYTAKYYPNVLTVVNGNPSSVPGEQTFTDTAAATGTGSVSGTARANSASANCPLCPPIH